MLAATGSLADREIAAKVVSAFSVLVLVPPRRRPAWLEIDVGGVLRQFGNSASDTAETSTTVASLVGATAGSCARVAALAPTSVLRRRSRGSACQCHCGRCACQLVALRVVQPLFADLLPVSCRRLVVRRELCGDLLVNELAGQPGALEDLLGHAAGTLETAATVSKQQMRSGASLTSWPR
jgi:hypothetical protein